MSLRCPLSFVWQFITVSPLSRHHLFCHFAATLISLSLLRLQLGGLHSNAYISDLFAAAFAKEGMKAYVELVQRRERDIGCDVLTHQKVSPAVHLPGTSLRRTDGRFRSHLQWSGAEFIDSQLMTVTGGV